VRPALAAIADDDNLLALDEVNVSIPVIINAHVIGPCLNNSAGISGLAGLRQASISMGPMCVGEAGERTPGLNR
jgi:hypothetical protein